MSVWSRLFSTSWTGPTGTEETAVHGSIHLYDINCPTKFVSLSVSQSGSGHSGHVLADPARPRVRRVWCRVRPRPGLKTGTENSVISAWLENKTSQLKFLLVVAVSLLSQFLQFGTRLLSVCHCH